MAQSLRAGAPPVGAGPEGAARAARIASLAALLQLPAPPSRSEVDDRIADLEAYRQARDEADDLAADAADAARRIAELGAGLAELGRQLATAADVGPDAADRADDASLPTDDTVLDHRLRAAVFRQRAADAVSTWQRYAIARRLLLEAIDTYDLAVRSPLEHQASAYLREASKGRWTGASVDRGGLDLLDARGDHHDARTVGRSTAQLACLALRLALAEEAAGQQDAPATDSSLDAAFQAPRPGPEAVSQRLDPEPMPLVLDDVLLGLDEERRSATVKLLSQIADRRQVVLCTSDSSVADLARRHRRGVRVVELR